ncbi:TlpA family protein disulfide reductase [Pseudothauera rhizosphaerae]|uniref:TlpA family protein disulfide reductase n=1 Tax=Pseudothauera rhizosphaerae TaxID=2565932 RepID=A0A4S4AT54_9RHOO|nr:TlpA disulfide reductase family protein [Pseudothauera rhizosphaerae]THF61739.1 TlpA family protein disulfide reductase [Pseudothauera rhizosphaerae]
MKRPLQIVLIALVAVGAATAGYLTNRATAPQPPAAAGVAPDAGRSLLALSLPDLAGTPQSLAQWQGKVLVVNFWATWCAPCRKEIPDFAAVSQRLAGDPVQFVGLSIDSAEKVRAFHKEFAVPYPLLVGTPDTLRVAAELGNKAQALPFTVILDRGGRIAHVKLGTLKADELEGRIRALLPPRNG